MFNDAPQFRPSYGIFSGDGRIIIRPVKHEPNIPGTEPHPIRRCAARRLIDGMLTTGQYVATSKSHFVWVVLEFCRHNELAYELKVDLGCASIEVKLT